LIHEKIRAKEEWIYLPLRDNTTENSILSGLPAVLTSDGLQKPSYFAYQMLSHIKGELLSWGKQYSIIKAQPVPDAVPVFYVLASNFNDEIYHMCTEETTSHQAKDILNHFKDEIDFNATLNLPPGLYTVMKYALTRNHNIFSYLASFDFNDDTQFIKSIAPLIPSAPELEIYQEDVRTSFHINFTIKGPGIQMAVIKQKGDSKDAK